MTTRYVPRKSTEVEAIQLTKETLGELLIKLNQLPAVGNVTFEVSTPSKEFNGFIVSFRANDYTTQIIGEGEFVVFGGDDYDVMKPEQFHEMFEPHPGEGEQKTQFPLPGKIPNGFTPYQYQPRAWPLNGEYSYEQIIVKD